MAINLVSLVMQSLTSENIGKIASALGLDQQLGPEGRQRSSTGNSCRDCRSRRETGRSTPGCGSVSQEGTSALSNLGRTLEGSGYKAMAEHGSGLLGSLLGNSTQSGLASALGKFAGIGEAASSSLLGLLGPVVAATLGRQQNAQGLDASGLVNLLSAQKDNISAALPSGFANLLDGTDVLDSLGEHAASTARSTATAAYRAADRAPEKTSSMSWLAWAISLVALLGLGWYFVGQQARKPVEVAATTTTQSTSKSTPETAVTTVRPPRLRDHYHRRPPRPTTATTTTQSTPAPAASLTVEGVDLGTSVTSAIDGLKTSLEGITDTRPLRRRCRRSRKQQRHWTRSPAWRVSSRQNRRPD